MFVLRGRSAVGAPIAIVLALLLMGGCDTGTGDFRPPADTAGGRPTIGAEGAPTLTMIMPTTDQFVFQGDTVQLSWVDTDPDDDAEVTVFAFLDGDRNQAPDTGAVTLVLDIVSEDPDGASDMYTWLTAGFPEGTYTVGATIDDFENPPMTDFAAGQVSIVTQFALGLDLNETGVSFAGTRWRGWNSGDMAGYAMDGGMDVNGDGADDFVIVSRFGNPFYLRPGAGPWGEAYLVYGRSTRFQAVEELNGVAAGIAGTIYAAPRSHADNYVTDNGSSGLMSVTMIPNVETAEEDPAAGAEIMFGVPFVDGLADELDPDEADADDLNDNVDRFCVFNQFEPGTPIEIEVLGIEGWYLDHNEVDAWWFTYTYEAPDCCPNPDYDPICDPNSGQYSEPNCPDPNNGFACLPVEDVTVSMLLPYVLTFPGELVLNENCDGYDTGETVPAVGYPLAYGPFSYSDDDDDDDLFPAHTGVALLASSVGNGGIMDGEVVDLDTVGGEDTNIDPTAWGSTWSYGVRFRPPYTHTGQNEVDNWEAWEPPRAEFPGWLFNGEIDSREELIPSDWAHTIGFGDVDGSGNAELLIGAPRMGHTSTWSTASSNGIYVSVAPTLLHQGFTANVTNQGPAENPYQLIDAKFDPNNPSEVGFTNVQVGDKVIIHHGSGSLDPVRQGTYLVTGSEVDKVFLDRDPGVSIISNPTPPPVLTFADDVWYMIPDRRARSNDEETGGVAVIVDRLGQPSNPNFSWYDDRNGTLDPPAFAGQSDEYPSWPNLPVGTLTWLSTFGCTPTVGFTPRQFYYPVTDFLHGDLESDGGPTAIDPLQTTNRMIDGGQLGGMSDMADSGVTGPATPSLTGLAPFDPLTGTVVQGGVLAYADFNSDGLDDLASGAPAADPGGVQDAGIAYLVYGRRPFGTHNIGNIDNLNVEEHLPGIELEGTVAGDRTGTAMARVAYYKPNLDPPAVVDFNGDGFADWLIGVPGRDPSGRNNAGAAVVIFGHQASTPIDGSFTLDDINEDVNGPPQCGGCPGEPDGIVDEWDLRGVVLMGEQAGDELGYYVAGVGDTDGDGYADILISAPGADGVCGEGSGKVYLVYGSPALMGTYDLRDLGTEVLPGKIYHGAGPDQGVGPLARAGDVDGDGFDDYLIGNPLATQPTNKVEAGECYLIYGTLRNQP